MTNQNDSTPDPDVPNELSAEGTEHCLRMLDGASPSDLGISMAEAANLLSAFAKTYRQALGKDSSMERRLGREIVLNIEEAESLWKIYRQAAALTDELLG